MSSEEDILDVLETVSRSVVNINTASLIQDSFHRTLPIRGMGSGFIIEPDGLIVTNAHVVMRARRIGVVLHDGNLVEGVRQGICRSIDISVIKVDVSQSNKLTPAVLGDSNQLRVGQRVYAIGNPFGLEGGPSVTSGVISALNRSIQSREGSFTNLVQTDAPINPGNSGGPLVDIQGNVIAINTAIIPYAQGIGFAIPINTVKDCVEQINVHGRMTTPWVGIYGVTVTSQVASYYNLRTDRGVLVTNVVRESPAYKSKIAVGDVVAAFNEVNIASVDELKTKINQKKIGELVNLVIIRGLQRHVVNLTIEGRP
jgi:S1-C subfamily serine protease